MRPILLLTALLASASAQETLIRTVFDAKTDTHVEVLALFTQPSQGGYMPVRVKIANNLETARSIRLRFDSTATYSNNIQTRSSFDFSAGAGKTVTQDIMVPLCSSPNPHNQTSLSVNLGGSLGNASNTMSTTMPNTMPAVLMSEALFTPNASVLDAASLKGSSSRGYGNQTFAGKFDPKQLPNDWLAYSGYDSVIMTDADWSNVPPGGRNAILSWVRLGGQLVVYTATKSSLATLGIPEQSSFGTVELQPIASDMKLNANDTITLVGTRNSAAKRSSSITNDYQSGWPLQILFGSQAFNYGIFIAVLILFGILVGPINLFVFAKSGQRHRLFITTPIISLAASLLLIAIIIFQDGFGGQGMRRVLMEIRPDAGGNSAYLHQEQFSRTGILTSARFKVEPACLMLPVPIDKTRWARYTSDYNTSGNFTLDTVTHGPVIGLEVRF